MAPPIQGYPIPARDMSPYTHIEFWAKGGAGMTMSIRFQQSGWGDGGAVGPTVNLEADWTEHILAIADFTTESWEGNGIAIDWRDVYVIKMAPDGGADGTLWIDEIAATKEPDVVPSPTPAGDAGTHDWTLY